VAAVAGLAREWPVWSPLRGGGPARIVWTGATPAGGTRDGARRELVEEGTWIAGVVTRGGPPESQRDTRTTFPGVNDAAGGGESDARRAAITGGPMREVRGSLLSREAFRGAVSLAH